MSIKRDTIELIGKPGRIVVDRKNLSKYLAKGYKPLHEEKEVVKADVEEVIDDRIKAVKAIKSQKALKQYVKDNDIDVILNLYDGLEDKRDAVIEALNKE